VAEQQDQIPALLAIMMQVFIEIGIEALAQSYPIDILKRLVSRIKIDFIPKVEYPLLLETEIGKVQTVLNHSGSK